MIIQRGAVRLAAGAPVARQVAVQALAIRMVVALTPGGRASAGGRDLGTGLAVLARRASAVEIAAAPASVAGTQG